MFGSTVEKIMRLGTKKKGAKIVPYLKSRDKQVRMAAIAALGQAGGEEAFDSLTYILSSAADQERIAAVHALGALGNSKAISYLMHQLKKENNPEFDEACKQSIKQLKEENK